MLVALLWLLLAVASAAFEIGARRSHRWLSLAELGSRISSHWIGRFVLLLCWAFVGWHLFSRYSRHPL